MARSINELTLDEHRALSRYVDAIAARDPAVRLGLADARSIRRCLLAEFDARLRLASSQAMSRSEAFRSALLGL